jgi:hypothetical protein
MAVILFIGIPFEMPQNLYLWKFVEKVENLDHVSRSKMLEDEYRVIEAS